MCSLLILVFLHTVTSDVIVAGDALYLSRFIHNGSATQGRLLSKVKAFNDTIQSHAGFITVDETMGSNIFFWYFPAEMPSEKAEVIIWLDGWGTSSLFSVFVENGPYFISPSGGLESRAGSWNKRFHMLYLDTHVGVGFSYTRVDAGYPRNVDDVTRNLFVALKQFFMVFPELKNNDIYIGGHSYSGIYSTSFFHHLSSLRNLYPLQLKGLCLLNPLFGPSQLHYSDYLYQLGLVDKQGNAVFKEEEREFDQLMKERRLVEANIVARRMIWHRNPTLFSNLTGFPNPFDYYNPEPLPRTWISFVQKPHVRNALHIGNLTFQLDAPGLQYLRPHQLVRSTIGKLEDVLKSNRVLIVIGQQDVFTGYARLTEVVESLEWDEKKTYMAAKRKIWVERGQVAGYVKSSGRFEEVLLRKAGHIPGLLHPVLVRKLIENFILGIPLTFI